MPGEGPQPRFPQTVGWEWRLPVQGEHVSVLPDGNACLERAATSQGSKALHDLFLFVDRGWSRVVRPHHPGQAWIRSRGEHPRP